MSCLRQVWHLYGVCRALCSYRYLEMDEYREDAKRQKKGILINVTSLNAMERDDEKVSIVKPVTMNWLTRYDV